MEDIGFLANSSGHFTVCLHEFGGMCYPFFFVRQELGQQLKGQQELQVLTKNGHICMITMTGFSSAGNSTLHGFCAQ